MAAHARFGPSSMSRILACPGSVKLQEMSPPQPESPYAAEGTLAHAIAEQMLLGVPDDELEPCDQYPDMMDAVRKYADYCNPLLDVADKYGIETKLKQDHELFGTADCWVLVHGILHVIDYKHGQGVSVSPENNRQGMTYAGLIFADEDIDIDYDDVESVMITIIQPRTADDVMPAIKHWMCSPKDIEAHMFEVERAIETAKKDNAPVALGDHCKFCTAKLKCPALAAAERGVDEWNINDIEPDLLGKLLDRAHVLEGKIKEIYAYCERRLEAGEHIPGYKLVQKRATRKWIDTDGVEKWAKRHGKMNLIHKKSLLSPAQVAKVVTHSEFEALSQYIDAVSSGTTIAKESDKREAVLSPGAALRALGKRIA